MTGDAVQRIFERISRLRGDLEKKGGEHFQHDVTLPEGDTYTYAFKNLKSPKIIQDDVASCFVWTWSIKDYLQPLSIRKGKPATFLDDFVNSNPRLQLCADIANQEKHGNLRKSRSGLFPKLGDVRFSIPQEAISQLEIGAFRVGIDVSNPTLVEFTLPVYSNDNEIVADAFVLLDESVGIWQELLTHL